MDNPAALHRLKVGVPATVEHSSGEDGVETGKWVAEVTQVRSHLLMVSLLTLEIRADDLFGRYLDWADAVLHHTARCIEA